MSIEVIGPKLSDIDFFTKVIDTSKDGMEKVKQAIEDKDFKTARKNFAEYIRENLKPELFFKIPYEKGGNDFTFKGESELETADRILTHCFISCGTPLQFGDKVDWFANPTENKYKEWTWQLSRHHEFNSLARAYLETKDEKYAKCFAELFASWVKQATVPEPTSGYDTLCWRTIEAGIRMGSWPYALHSFYKSENFTDDILIDWYKSVWEHGWRLRNFSTMGNWLIMEMNGLAHIGILYPEFKDSKEWTQWALIELDRQLDIQIYPDSFQYELSTSYHGVVINNYFSMIQLAETYFNKIPKTMLNKLENACELYVKLPMPDGRLPCLNDGCWRNVKELLSLRTKYFNNREDFKWFITDKKEGLEPQFKSICLPYSGLAVMRSGWDEDAVWGIFDDAPFGRAHQHEDKLSMLVYANKKLLITEGGTYAYDSSEIRKYVLSTRSHNTVRVDGCDQNRRENYCWSDEDIKKDSGIKFSTNGKFDFASGEYNEGYGDKSDIDVTHKRSVYFIKESIYSNKPFFIVVDRLYSTENVEREYEILWHLTEDQVNLKGLSATTENIKILVSEAKTMRVALHIGEKEPQWQGWKIVSSKQGDYIAAPTLCYSLRNTMVRVVTVLCPYSKSEPCYITKIVASEDVNDTSITLIMEDGLEYTLSELEIGNSCM